MKYRELVARISEVTRTLVAAGSNGEFDSDSRQFRMFGRFPEETKAGFLLRVKGGPMAGLYPIVEVTPSLGVVGLSKDTTVVSCRFVDWELYDPGVSEEGVRSVLDAFPDVLMECEEGESVRTTLGMFRLTRRKRKRVKDPYGKWTFSEERIVARIRPGKRLQREVPKPSGPSIPVPKTRDLPSDEDL